MIHSTDKSSTDIILKGILHSMTEVNRKVSTDQNCLQKKVSDKKESSVCVVPTVVYVRDSYKLIRNTQQLSIIDPLCSLGPKSKKKKEEDEEEDIQTCSDSERLKKQTS